LARDDCEYEADHNANQGNEISYAKGHLPISLYCKVPLEDDRRCGSSRAGSNRRTGWPANKPSGNATSRCARRHFPNEATAGESKCQSYGKNKGPCLHLGFPEGKRNQANSNG
jgi:hypothetical protein